MTSLSAALAQPFPVPPPIPMNTPEQEHIAPNDKTPPKIEILTDSLHSGKNVFEVKITDDSSLRVREVKFVQNGQLKTEGLFRDVNDVYKALVDIQPPSRVVVVTAGDAAGNLATDYREYDVAAQGDLFKNILDIFAAVPHFISQLLGRL